MILQLAPLELFEKLGAGDFLVYDGSHVARAASDVNWFLFEERGQTWNEQYVLQAFFMYNSEFEIHAANAALLVEDAQRSKLSSKVGDEPVAGGSLWIRRTPRPL